MGFKITISDNGKYIIGKLDSPLNREIALQLAKEYTTIINSTGINRILNDVRGITDEMGVFKGYEYAYRDVKSLNLPQVIRAAIVVSEGDTTHNFQETVANNAGYKVKIFQSIKEAVDWLLDDLI